jgi:hypothetical protein
MADVPVTETEMPQKLIQLRNVDVRVIASEAVAVISAVRFSVFM